MGVLLEEQRIQIHLCTSRGRNVQATSSVNWTDNLVLNILKSTREIRYVKLHDETEPDSMQNYKAVRKLIEMLALKLTKK